MRLPNIIVFVFVTVLMVVSVTGCYYDKEELLYPTGGTGDCSTISARFLLDVSPIIVKNCAISGCHDAASAAGGAVFESYPQIAEHSAHIMQRVVIDKTMPKNGTLPQSEINIIKCWIESGAPNN